MKKKVMITFQENHAGAGPYKSHERIIELLKDEYDFFPLYIPQGRIGVFNPKLVANLIKQINNVNPDIIHIHGLQLAGYQLMKAAVKTKKKTVLAVRGSVNEALYFSNWKKRIVNYCEKYTLKKADAVYGVSDYVSNWHIVKKHSKNLFGTIYNMPDYNPILNNFKVREHYRISDSDVIIISTGRITKEKGYDVFCNAILKWKPSSDIKFMIVGDGDYLEEFKASVRHLGKQVIFTGVQETVLPFLQASDIFVICTKHETLCNSILEAAQEKLPVIATNVGGIPEIVKHNSTGYLANNYDVDDFVDCMKILCEDAEKRKLFGKNAFMHVQKCMDKEKIKEQLMSIYEKLV